MVRTLSNFWGSRQQFTSRQGFIFRHWRRALLVLVCAVAMPMLLWAQDNEFTPAQIVNDEGGPLSIRGQLSYTNEYLTMGISEPLVILEDQAGFVDRDGSFLISEESQTLGKITSDYFKSPFSYTVALPAAPQAALRDVDNDGEEDSGVMILAVAHWWNTFGDPFLEERDMFGGGWSIGYASTRTSTAVETYGEINGGKLLVFAPDEFQGFPVDFGRDGFLFTEDDPIGGLPQGYTVVELDTRPFTFDRSRLAEIDMIEGEESALVDFSPLSYSAAFDAMIEMMRKQYAFTDYKGIDWDALSEEFRPRFEAAEVDGDTLAYLFALRDFTLAIPDGHVAGPALQEEFDVANGGGLGMAIRDLDDGRTIANYVLEGGPADAAGIELKAEILAVNGIAVNEAVEKTVAWSGPFSTPDSKRLQQLRYVMRSPVGTAIDITFRNAGTAMEETVTLTSVAEWESFNFSSFNAGLTWAELPVEFELLDNGYGYVKIYSFSDDGHLTVQLWERMMLFLKENEVPGLMIDMRQNDGGDVFLAHQMGAYFFDEPLELGTVAYYDKNLDDFYMDLEFADHFFLPAEDLRYHGNIAVLIGPNCNSACELFSYDLTLQERAAMVGHYPTAGLGGVINSFLMPEGESITFTMGRSVDMKGDIHIEGKGIAPTIDVPVTEETLFREEDPILEAAIAHLDEVVEERVVVPSTP